MLYSTTIKIQDKEFKFKIGMKELIRFKKAGINIQEFTDGNIDFEDIMNVAYICILSNNANAVNMTFDEFVDFYDESDLTVEELSKHLEEAIFLGVHKGKYEKKTPIPKNP